MEEEQNRVHQRINSLEGQLIQLIFDEKYWPYLALRADPSVQFRETSMDFALVRNDQIGFVFVWVEIWVPGFLASVVGLTML
jgi:hypothetical protein